MVHIEKNKVPDNLYKIPVVLFGGGSTGKVISHILKGQNVEIKFFVDDDESKWGEKIDGTEIVSFDKFLEFCNTSSGIVPVVMASIYGKAILNHIENIKQVQVFEMYSWYCEEVNHKSGISGIDAQDEIEKFKINTASLENKWADKESAVVLDGLYNYLVSKDINYISRICTDKEQYFIPEVLLAINKPLSIIDAGAYEGELLHTIRKFNIGLDKWYCFEADASNYKRLLQRKDKNGTGLKQVCVNKGLWDEEKRIYFLNGDSASRIVDYETGSSIETTTIDSFFHSVSVNFIKMDIEGAEYAALAGGINVIRRDRPVLAISIYHSIEDFYRIPMYLMENLTGYKYYVRHHSLIFCETVLYAVPCVLENKQEV